MPIVARRTDVQTTILPDGYVAVFERNQQRIGTLPPVAGMIWEHCDGTTSVKEIVAMVRSYAEISDAIPGEKEIADLIEQLVTEGFLIVSEAK